MPRPLRLVLPGVAVHVIQRGNNRVPCFKHDNDYLMYLAHLRQLSGKYQCAVHAYCLMTNHVHLLLTPAQANACATLMRNLGQRYVQRFNRTYERTGTLWEGRFRSFLVESARYVLACYRYIEQNPVRAGMVRSAAGYRWSSYLGNAGLRTDPLLTPHVEYQALGAEPAQRYRAYRELVDGELAPDELSSIREAARKAMPLGGEAFKAQIEIDLGRPHGHRRGGHDPRSRGRTSGVADFEGRIGSGPRRGRQGEPALPRPPGASWR